MKKTRTAQVFLYCRRCGSELKGFYQNMGVCTTCVFDTKRAQSRKIGIPGYSFNTEEELDGD